RDLRHHAAYPDAGQVSRAVVELDGQCGGIGGEVAERVPGGLRVEGCGRAGIAEVVADDVTAQAGKSVAQRVGPGEHRGAAHAQHQRTRRVSEMFDGERDAVDLARRRFLTHR